MQTIDLGRRNYRDVWDLQKKLHAQRVSGAIPNTLILVEHDPVITMGKSGKQGNVLFPVGSLNERGVDFYNIERGGDATFHGPGQLVGYPIFNVKDGLAGIKPFIARMEEAVIATLAEFGIDGCVREKMIGVWTQTGKICSIGIAVQRWVSFHGFALNVNTDLSFFDLIVPCGLKNVEMTSMERMLGQRVPMDAVRESVIANFGKVFEQEVTDVCSNEIT